jgi:hypothetical protein
MRWESSGKLLELAVTNAIVVNVIIPATEETITRRQTR